jgi:hypothetical protein
MRPRDTRFGIDFRVHYRLQDAVVPGRQAKDGYFTRLEPAKRPLLARNHTVYEIDPDRSAMSGEDYFALAIEWPLW